MCHRNITARDVAVEVAPEVIFPPKADAPLGVNWKVHHQYVELPWRNGVVAFGDFFFFYTHYSVLA